MRISARSRAVAIAKGLAIMLIGLATLTRTLIVAFSWERYAAGYAELSERYNFLFIGVILGSLTLVAFYPVLRPGLARRAEMRLEDDQWLVIDRPGLLRKPLTVARSDIAAVAVDDGSRHGSDRKHRFPLVYTDAEADYAAVPRSKWLYSIDEGSPLPLLNTTREAPNVAILLSEPQEMKPLKRVTKSFRDNSSFFLPARRPQSGLLLTVVDPETARRAFEPWGVVRDIAVEEVDRIRPTEAQWRTTRALVIARNLAVLALIAAQVFFVFAKPVGDLCDPRQVFCDPPVTTPLP